jgi:hypothetical protein
MDITGLEEARYRPSLLLRRRRQSEAGPCRLAGGLQDCILCISYGSFGLGSVCRGQFYDTTDHCAKFGRFDERLFAQ